jgi:hypothetical protein
MFLPAAMDEMRKLGWNALDVILVTGDSYIDSPLLAQRDAASNIGWISAFFPSNPRHPTIENLITIINSRPIRNGRFYLTCCDRS